MKRPIATFFILLATLTLTANRPSQAVLLYIEQYQEIAVNEMIEFRIPASITMAQGILESGAGQSELAKKSNNHFGIKCHTDWKGDKVYYDDDAKDECFRKYDHVEDSYRDHSEFLSNKTRYADLFELDPDDYKGWAKGLKAAGYATNPKYADLLINLIEEYELNKLDKMSLAEVKKKEKKKVNENNPVVINEDVKPDKKKTKKDEKFTWGGYNGEVYYYNRIPTVNIKDGDTPEKLAEYHKVKISLLKDYNDIESGGELLPGTKFYLQPKRKTGSSKAHIVKEGESMWTISREEGVRLKYLYKYNRLEPGQEPAVGEEVYLRNKRKDAPKLKMASVNKSTGTNNKTTKSSPQENNIFIDEENEEIAPAEKEEVTKKSSVEEIGIEEKKVIIAEDDTAAPVYHIVAEKETLYALSKKYSVTVQQIQEWNNLKDNSIRVGQKIIIGYK